MVIASFDSPKRMVSKQSPPTPAAGCHDAASSHPSICGTCCGSRRCWILSASDSSRRSASSSRRRARPASISACIVASRCALSHGFCTKSRTPRRIASTRSEEHTSELQSHSDLVCRLLLEKKKKQQLQTISQKQNKK